MTTQKISYPTPMQALRDLVASDKLPESARETGAMIIDALDAAMAWHETVMDVPPRNDEECEASERFQTAMHNLMVVDRG